MESCPRCDSVPQAKSFRANYKAIITVSAACLNTSRGPSWDAISHPSRENKRAQTPTTDKQRCLLLHSPFTVTQRRELRINQSNKFKHCSCQCLQGNLNWSRQQEHETRGQLKAHTNKLRHACRQIAYCKRKISAALYAFWGCQLELSASVSFVVHCSEVRIHSKTTNQLLLKTACHLNKWQYFIETNYEFEFPFQTLLTARFIEINYVLDLYDESICPTVRFV